MNRNRITAMSVMQWKNNHSTLSGASPRKAKRYAMSNLSRRDFLKLARDGFLYLSGAMAFVGFLRFLDFDPKPAPKTEFDLGPVEDYPLGSRIVLNEIPAILIHTESGFTALSLTCTHLGCTVESTTAGFSCPCHASTYDLQGNVLNGPAEKRLPSLWIEVTLDERLLLYTSIQEKDGKD